jgi:hypothetical protein
MAVISKRALRVVAGLLVALTAVCVSATLAAASSGQGAATGPPGFPGGWPTSPSPIFPVVSGPITVTLSPLSSSTPGAASPAAGPVIVCYVNLGQHVHYSNTGKDTSWHWTWSCDESVSLTGGDALYVQGYPIVTGGVAGGGTSGNENIRYNGCVGAYWWGSAYGTFSAPGYTPGSFEGSSPTSLISCP